MIVRGAWPIQEGKILSARIIILCADNGRNLFSPLSTRAPSLCFGHPTHSNLSNPYLLSGEIIRKRSAKTVNLNFSVTPLYEILLIRLRAPDVLLFIFFFIFIIRRFSQPFNVRVVFFFTVGLLKCNVMCIRLLKIRLPGCTRTDVF